ncbi:restriction endonuclease fold toxin-2 domain-containing protein [Streptomyces sp. NPDC014733]|uniref:restriction endonuclease fold toxin-2 domain-containing protein n=1 Tax=Streptomyces sp. NPDC014733 TaxID=3364885 RepID=UPI0036FC04E2
MAAISSRLLAMATNYLMAEDHATRALAGKIDTTSPLKSSPGACDPSQAHNSLPMVTGSKEVHEIPVIGKFWPQGDPEKLRNAAHTWATCADLIDEAQGNARRHAADVKEQCRGEAFDRFHDYTAKVYSDRASGGKSTSPSLPLMENISASCRLMHDACNEYADAIDTCRHTLIGLGVAAGVVTAAGVILTVFTLGASDGAAAAGDAALAGEAAAAAGVLATAEADSAAAAAVAEAEAIVARLAAQLNVGAGTLSANGATPTNLLSSSSPAGPVGPVPPPTPPPYPPYSPSEQAAAAAWIQTCPQRAPNYGNAEDRAYQVRVAGSPERSVDGADGSKIWADGYRPADGALIDAKNVRKMGCSPRQLRGIHEDSFSTGLMLGKDDSEIARYGEALRNPNNHAQYLEVDTPDQSTVGYWQYLCAKHHVPSNVRHVP